jgi:hypothetical protein
MNQQPQQQRPYPLQNPQYEHQDPKKRTIEERMHGIIPTPISFDLLNNLDKMSVIQLCEVGREIIQDISFRVMNVFSYFKTEVHRRNIAVHDIEAILCYSKILFRKLQEVRIRIDQARMFATKLINSF